MNHLMPHKDPEVRRAYKRDYYRKNRIKLCARARELGTWRNRKINYDRVRKWQREWYKKNKVRYAKYQSEYHKNRRIMRSPEEKAADAAKAARWRKNHPDYNYRGRFGVDGETYKRLVSGPCQICDTTTRERVLDHKHGTKKQYRGVLCKSCNMMLGWLENRRGRIATYMKWEIWE